MKEFKDLSDEEREEYINLASSILDGYLWCNRHWSAWSYGTMTENDFSDATENAYEKAEEIYNFLFNKIRKAKINNIVDESV